LYIGLKDNYDIEWDAEHHRLRCNGHIINLAAQAFLFPENDEGAFAAENNADILVLPTEEEVVAWRNKGPLGKLHNIVVYV
jgi:hypothetical protein